jgi:hypothetical protein
LLRKLRDADPGARLTIDAANDHVPAGALYKALKETRKLVKRKENCSRPDRFDIALFHGAASRLSDRASVVFSRHWRDGLIMTYSPYPY